MCVKSPKDLVQNQMGIPAGARDSAFPAGSFQCPAHSLVTALRWQSLDSVPRSAQVSEARVVAAVFTGAPEGTEDSGDQPWGETEPWGAWLQLIPQASAAVSWGSYMWKDHVMPLGPGGLLMSPDMTELVSSPRLCLRSW